MPRLCALSYSIIPLRCIRKIGAKLPRVNICHCTEGVSLMLQCWEGILLSMTRSHTTTHKNRERERERERERGGMEEKSRERATHDLMLVLNVDLLSLLPQPIGKMRLRCERVIHICSFYLPPCNFDILPRSLARTFLPSFLIPCFRASRVVEKKVFCMLPTPPGLTSAHSQSHSTDTVIERRRRRGAEIRIGFCSYCSSTSYVQTALSLSPP